MYYLQIVDETGEVVRFRAGGPVELDLCQALTAALVNETVAGTLGPAVAQRRLIDLAKQAILAQGVGFWRTEAHVTQAIEVGLRAALVEVAADLAAESTTQLQPLVARVFQAFKRRMVAVV